MLSTSTSRGEEGIYCHHPTYQLAHSVGLASAIDVQDVSRKLYMLVNILFHKSRLFRKEYLISVWFRLIPRRKESKLISLSFSDARIKIWFIIVRVSTLLYMNIFYFFFLYFCIFNFFYLL